VVGLSACVCDRSWLDDVEPAGVPALPVGGDFEPAGVPALPVDVYE